MAANAWTPLGPDCVIDGQLIDSNDRAPVSGRVTCFAQDGATLYVGTAGGGVWRTADQGVTWTPLGDDQPTLAIGAMVMDAANHRLYVGTGEGNRGGRIQFGQGLLALDTAGGTWSRFTGFVPGDPDGFRTRRSNVLMLEPNGANPPIVWLGTSSGLFISATQGASWTRAGFNGLFDPDISGLVRVHDSAGDQILAAVWSNGVWRRDASGTFQPLPTGGAGQLPGGTVARIGLAVAPSDPQVVYAVIAAATGGFVGVFRSPDGGRNWVRRKLPNNGSDLGQGWYNLALAVHPTDQDTLIFGEVRLWRSVDGGQNWDKVSDSGSGNPAIHADQHGVLFDAADPQIVWAGNDGGVWRSSDGGAIWRHRNRGLATLQYYAIMQHPSSPAVLLAGAQDNGMQRYVGNPGWELVDFGDGFFCAVDQTNPAVWYDSYVYYQDGDIKAIQRSDQAGAPGSWGHVTDGIDPTEYAKPDGSIVESDLPFYVPFVTVPDSQNVFLGTTRLYRSFDQGRTWRAVRDNATGRDFSVTGGAQALGTNSISAICVDPNDSNVIYVGTYDGKVFQLTHTGFDRGVSLCDVKLTTPATSQPPIPAPPVPSAMVTDLAVPRVAAGSGLAARPLYVAFGSDYVNSIAPRRVDHGRIWKVDFSPATPSWTPLATASLTVSFGPGQPDLPHELNFCNALAIHPSDPQRIFLGCHVGVFQSTDGGTSWAPFRDDLPNAAVVDLQLHPTGLLRAGTMGRSVWERPIDPVAAPATTAEVYIRDNIIDIGRFQTPASGTDPTAPPATVEWWRGVDIKVDTDRTFGGFEDPSSTEDYTGATPMDYIGFQQLDDDDFNQGKKSRIHIQVANRGPQPATGVVVRAFWALKGGSDPFPDLPASFWSDFPDTDPPPASPWKAVGPKITVGTLPADHPRVVTWQLDVPREDKDICVLAVISSNEDPVSGSGTDVQTVVEQNKHVVLRKVAIAWPPEAIVVTILSIVGLVALGAGAIYAATR